MTALRHCVLALAFGLLARPVAGRTLDVVVRSPQGPLAGVVVWVDAGADVTAAVGKTAVMDQVHKAFVPFILPIQRGTTVDFPNSDPINHHVYSFSPAKRFDLKLFKDENRPHTETFDTPGIVTLGCNIHDWMLGYVVVLDSPWFGQTDASGRVRLALPKTGELSVHVWHPRIADPQENLVKHTTGPLLEFDLVQPLKPDPRPRPGAYD